MDRKIVLQKKECRVKTKTSTTNFNNFSHLKWNLSVYALMSDIQLSILCQSSKYAALHFKTSN